MPNPSLTLAYDGQWRRLGLEARPTLADHAKISALIRSRLGQDDAQLLAVPEMDGWTDAASSWRSQGGGALTPAKNSNAHQAAIARVEELARSLEGQGEAGRLAAHMLRLAVITPTGAPAYFVDAATGAPVLANWGLAAPGQTVPEFAGAGHAAATAATATTAATARAASAATTETPEEPDRSTPPAERSSVAALPWLVPAALAALAIWLGLTLANPLPPEFVKVTPSAEAADDPTPELVARIQSLDTALGETREAEERFGKACIAQAPTPEAPPSTRIALPPEPLQEIEPEALEQPPPVIAEAPGAPTPPRRPPDLIDPLPRAVERENLPPPSIESRPAPPPIVAEAPPVAAAPERCNPTWRAGREPRMVFVVDGSGSMRNSIPGASSRIGAAKQSISRVVQNLHKDIRIGMVSFSDCGATANTGYYGAGERGRLIREVNGIQPGRATSLAASIRRGAALANRRAETVLVVLSDGEDTCGQDPCAAAREAKRQKPGLTINVIDLSGGRSGGVLQCIARAGGGKVFAPGSAQQMAGQIQQATGQPDASGC